MDRPLISEGMRVAVIQYCDLPCLLLQRVACIRQNGDFEMNYFKHALSSELFVHHFHPETTGVSVPHISPDQICSFIVPVPPVTEQKSIAIHIDQETAKIDSLITEAERAIDLLKEHRSALISAAVTGKVDVRGLVAVEAETEAAS